MLERKYIFGSRDNRATQPAAFSTCICRSSSVTQPAEFEAATNVSEQLVQGMLDKAMGDVTEIVARAHYNSFRPLPALNKARKEEMRSRSFGLTINSLQRAYSKLLHENFENEWSSEIAGNVRGRRGRRGTHGKDAGASAERV